MSQRQFVRLGIKRPKQKYFCPTSNTLTEYKFTGSCDKNISYIGETRRQLFRRINEHRENGNNSGIFSHLFDCTICQNTEEFSNCFDILQSGTRYNIMCLESLLISRHQPSLNKQMGPSRGTISLRLYY